MNNLIVKQFMKVRVDAYSVIMYNMCFDLLLLPSKLQKLNLLKSKQLLDFQKKSQDRYQQIIQMVSLILR